MERRRSSSSGNSSSAAATQMRCHLSHILSCSKACEILGEETVRRIIASLLKLRRRNTVTAISSSASKQLLQPNNNSNNNNNAMKPVDTKKEAQEVEALVQALMYPDPTSSSHSTITTAANHQKNHHHHPVPQDIQQAWKRLMSSRALALDKNTLISFVVPQVVQPHPGPSGHMGLFDCWIYTLQGHAPISSSSPATAAAATASYYGGGGSGANAALASQLVWIPDVLIMMAVAKQYRDFRKYGLPEKKKQVAATTKSRSSGSSNNNNDVVSDDDDDHDDGTNNHEPPGVKSEVIDDSEEDDREVNEDALLLQEEAIVYPMARLSFRVYDSYQKKGCIARDTMHRFLTDVHGEDSYKEARTRALLDQVFAPTDDDHDDDDNHDVLDNGSFRGANMSSSTRHASAAGWLQTTVNEEQYCRRVWETFGFRGQRSHLLLDWMADLFHAMIPMPEIPPSVTAYLDTMEHRPRPLCEVYKIAENRLFEIKRRFHSMVRTSSSVIQGDIMISSSAEITNAPEDGGGGAGENNNPPPDVAASSSSSSSPMSGAATPKHAVHQSAFVDIVSRPNEEMGHGGYLPSSLASLVFAAVVRPDHQDDDGLVHIPGQDPPKRYWEVQHVLQFGCMAVRRPSSNRDYDNKKSLSASMKQESVPKIIDPQKPIVEDDVPLLRFLFGVFQLGAPPPLKDGMYEDRRILTRDQVQRMLLLIIEHAEFRLEADRPLGVDDTTVHGDDMNVEEDAEEQMVDTETCYLLGLLPRSGKKETINGGQMSKVRLSKLVDYTMANAQEEGSLTFAEFCDWSRSAPDGGIASRLGMLMVDLRLIAAEVFGVPPTLASMEVSLISEIERRHKARYPQSNVSRRGPRGTVWYIIDAQWLKEWAQHVKAVSKTDKDAIDGRSNPRGGVRGLDRIDNAGLLAEDGSLALRNDIRWKHDYEILPPQAWLALQAWYDGGPPIYRTVVRYVGGSNKASSPHSAKARIPTENEIELYPLFVTVLLCDAASRGEARPFQQNYQMSRVSPVGVMLVLLCKQLDVDADWARLWVLGGAKSAQTPTRTASAFTSISGGVSGEGGSDDWILSLDSNIVDQRKQRNYASDGGKGITLLLELKDKETRLWPRGIDGKEWSFKEKTEADQINSDLGDGIVGLYNMGNTCYLNSSIQCISHTPILREYFTSKAYLNDVNTTNPLGHQGHLAQVCAVLINSLWKPSNTQNHAMQPKRVTAPGSYAMVNAQSLTPKTFKESLGKFNELFVGNEQHDAQEFLTFLLAGLSEDLNRIVDKPYIEAPDSDGRPDTELADIWWENHLKREMSIIVALFTGQYKNLLSCRSCKYESARFEPFATLTVPLPEDDHMTAYAVVYPLKEGSDILKYCLRVRSNGKLRDVLFELAKVLLADEGVSLAEESMQPGQKEDREAETEEDPAVVEKLKNLAVVDMRDGVICKIAPNSWSLQDLQNKDTGDLPVFHVYELDPVPEDTPEPSERGMDEDDTEFSEDYKPTHGFLAIAQRRTEVVSRDNLHPLAHRVFGTPVLIRLPYMEKCTGRKLYDIVACRLRNVVPKSALRFLMDNGSKETKSAPISARTESQEMDSNSRRSTMYSTTTDMEEVSAGPLPRYGFRLRVTTRDGRRCLICPWYKCSIGLLIPDDFSCSVMDGDSLVVDWHFAVDVATSGFGLRAGIMDPVSTQPSPQRQARFFSVPVKNHITCSAGTKRGGYGTITLEECLDAFSREERIPEAYCSKCKDFRVQTTRMTLWRLPPILIIHLKRFQFTQTSRRKLRELVVFPLEGLDLSRIMAPDGGQSNGLASVNVPEAKDAPKENGIVGGPAVEDIYIKALEDTTAEMSLGDNSTTTTEKKKGKTKDSKKDSMLYDLYGVVHHQGALSGGHYVASVKSELDGQWRLYNDSQIYEIHDRDVVDASAYILFYIRRDVVGANLSDYWNVRQEGQLSAEDMDQLLKGKSDRCVIS